jgi:hypothetical protein
VSGRIGGYFTGDFESQVYGFSSLLKMKLLEIATLKNPLGSDTSRMKNNISPKNSQFYPARSGRIFLQKQ